MTEMTILLPRVRLATPSRRSLGEQLRNGRGRHAEVRSTFGLGRRSRLASASRRHRRAVALAVEVDAALSVTVGLLAVVVALTAFLAVLVPLPEPTPRPVVLWSTPGEVCTVVPGSGDLSCYRGEIDR